MAVVSRTSCGARRIHVRGVVQGVGFRPHVFRLARAHRLAGWVLNGSTGVQIHVEGCEDALDAFVRDLRADPPPAANIAAIDVIAADVHAFSGFEIRESASGRPPTTRVAPDLPICGACLDEMFDPANRRFRYPYINCTNCGPRYSIVRGLPYDRAQTTMAAWPLCPACAAEYHDPEDRRFHAQPVACASCGPGYRLTIDGADVARGDESVSRAAMLLREGRILAIKGLGGYHLACDADNAVAVASLRHRKYRKEQAFAVMARDMDVAERTVRLTTDARALLTSAVRPIVVAPAYRPLAGVAPDNRDLGVMLPYAPLHHLLFAAACPERLVVTSGNRSSEPIAYADDDAVVRLAGLADAFLKGERPIARRVDDSVVRPGALGPIVLRRSRGMAPAAVAMLPTHTPILALGGDLKNAVTLVVEGQAYVSQHVGNLSDGESRRAFDETIRDLLAMYAIPPREATVVHDRHPDYASTAYAAEMGAARTIGVQHHRAHVASVLAERGAFDRRVVGVAFDGTGYGDDGAIWGGELFVGSIREGFTRAAHLRQARLAGGDASAHHPVQAAAGFVNELGPSPDLMRAPFCFPVRYEQASAVLRGGVRVFPTTSAGRLFDTVAALVGFTRPVTFEGQAAMWLEHLARGAVHGSARFTCRFTGVEIDWRDTLAEIIAARCRGEAADVIARAFHRSLAGAIGGAVRTLAEEAGVDTVVLTGGVMQNALLLEDVRDALGGSGLQLWTNNAVPPNDGGLSLGQAALAISADPA